MTEKEVLRRIKLYEDQLRLAQLYKEDFMAKLGVKGYENFINERLENLKELFDLHKKIRNAKNKN